MDNNIVSENRVGSFMIQRLDIMMRPDEVMAVLSRCLVFKADFALNCDAVEYHAFCSLFPPVQKHMRAPEYPILTETEYDEETKHTRLKNVGFEINGQKIMFED